MRKLKVIQILPTLNTGGVERGVLDFNNYLVKKGHESYLPKIIYLVLATRS